jgi:hypothetical protein
MIALIAGGSIVSLGLIFAIVYFATKKHDVKSPGTSPPITLGPSHPPAPPPIASQIISADKAKAHLGETCVVEMVVKRTGKNNAGDRFFLNSMENYRDPDCFTITFTKPVLDQLQQRGISDLEGYFAGKTVQVRGKVSKYKNPRDNTESLQIEVMDAAQLLLVNRS